MNLVLKNVVPAYLLVIIPFMGCTLITADDDLVNDTSDPDGPPDFDCTPDATEGGEDDFIPFVAGTVFDNNICPPGDVDVYTFTIDETTPQALEILLSFNVVNDLDLRLFQGRSNFPDGAPTNISNGSDSTERISTTPNTSMENEFLIEVQASTAASSPDNIVGNYSLTLDITPDNSGTP